MTRLPNTVAKKCRGCGKTLYLPYFFMSRVIWCEECTEEDALLEVADEVLDTHSEVLKKLALHDRPENRKE